MSWVFFLMIEGSRGFLHTQLQCSAFLNYPAPLHIFTVCSLLHPSVKRKTTDVKLTRGW